MYRTSILLGSPTLQTQDVIAKMPPGFRTCTHTFVRRSDGDSCVSIDLCDHDDTDEHLARVETQLQELRDFLVEQASNTPEMWRSLIMTATNVAEPYFTRTIPLSVGLMSLCVELGLSVEVQVCPCG